VSLSLRQVWLEKNTKFISLPSLKRKNNNYNDLLSISEDKANLSFSPVYIFQNGLLSNKKKKKKWLTLLQESRHIL
jgi:hypothetical protein